MTGMEQIVQINADARAAGTSYGKYIAHHSGKYGWPDGARKPRDMRVCIDCGKEFLPMLRSNGAPCKSKRCQACQDAARLASYRRRNDKRRGRKREHKGLVDAGMAD